MRRQLVILAEAFVALPALKRPLARVGTQVSVQTVPTCKVFTT